jgi:magnesium transporter
MDIFVYREGSDQVEEGYTVKQIPELLKDEQTVFWVDIEAPSEADDQVLLDVFKFHPLTVEDCRLNRHHPKVEEFPDYIYFIVHAVRTDSSPDHFNTIELDGFFGAQLCGHLSSREFPQHCEGQASNSFEPGNLSTWLGLSTSSNHRRHRG